MNGFKTDPILSELNSHLNREERAQEADESLKRELEEISRDQSRSIEIIRESLMKLYGDDIDLIYDLLATSMATTFSMSYTDPPEWAVLSQEDDIKEVEEIFKEDIQERSQEK